MGRSRDLALALGEYEYTIEKNNALCYLTNSFAISESKQGVQRNQSVFSAAFAPTQSDTNAARKIARDGEFAMQVGVVMFFKKKSPPAAKPAAAPPAAAKPAQVQAAPKPPAKKGGLKLPFGKKKATAPPPAKPAAPAPKPAGDAKPAVQAPAKTKGGGPLKLLLPLIVVAAVIGGGFFVYTRFIAPGAKSAAETQTIADIPAPANDVVAPGDVSKADARKTRQAAAANANPPPNASAENAGGAGANCAATPKFLAKLNLGNNALFEISDTHRLVLLLPSPDSDAVSKYQNQSWSQAGLVGAFATDRQGNVYVAPTPRLGPGVKAAQPQNTLYKVDTNTGELGAFVTLPDAAAPSPGNPFGIMGLAYDCDTNSLYVSSLAGSTADREAGHIYRVDLNLGAVAGRLDNVDALGLAVGSAADGKVLYFGSARAPQLRAVNLDAGGNFQGAARAAGALTGAERALRLTITSPGAMTAQTIAFDLSKAELPQGAEIQLQYEFTADSWSALP